MAGVWFAGFGCAALRYVRPCLAAAALWLLSAGVALAACDAGGADTPQQRVLALEREGRARPAECAAALGILLAGDHLDPSTRLEALTLRGWLLAGVPQDSEAEAVARQLDEWAPSEPAAAASALLVRARLAERGGNTRRANTLIGEALSRLPDQAPVLMRLRLLMAMSSIRNSAGKLDDAIRIDHEALKLADARGEAWRRADVRASLAYSYFHAAQTERALSINAEGMAIALRDGDPITLANLYTTQAIVSDGSADPREVKRAMEAAIEFARQAGAKADEALYLANLADFHLKTGDYATALRYSRQALPLTRELKSLNGQTVALANIGLALIAMNDIEAGKRWLRESIDIDERRGSLVGVSDTYAEMGQYLERAGDHRGALEALHQHRVLSDQILRRDQQDAIFEMQEQYDAERRSRELEMLQRDSQIKTEQLRAKDLQQGLWVLVAACGVLSLGVVLLLMQRVRQTNQRLAHSNAQLAGQADIDPLTGLSNRRRFQAAMRQLAADGKLQGTVLLADIDHFKRINDLYGHAAGDAVLVAVSQRLREMLREPDLVVRWGGEEFLVVVRALSADAVEALAQRMLDSIGGAPVPFEGRSIGLSVSIGYATFPIEPTLLEVSWERAINLVDTALYLAKAHGRNRAYGVRSLNARDEAQLDAIGGALEAAWRDGEVSLTQLDGPSGVRAAAAEPVAEAA